MQDLGPVIKEITDIGMSTELTVTGMSMYPLLRNRLDRVRLSKADDIKKYDIVLYRRENGAYILHRILKTGKDYVCCAGDNETELEKGVSIEKIIAKVTHIKRGTRDIDINSFIYRSYVRLWAFIFPLRRIVIYAYIKIRREFAEK